MGHFRNGPFAAAPGVSMLQCSGNPSRRRAFGPS